MPDYVASDIHVIPEHDLRDHVERRDCWCQPRLEEGEDSWGPSVIVVHNSMDGRELVEAHGVN